jgi:hypothetical protein
MVIGDKYSPKLIHFFYIIYIIADYASNCLASRLADLRVDFLYQLFIKPL